MILNHVANEVPSPSAANVNTDIWSTPGAGDSYLSFSQTEWYRDLTTQLIKFAKITKQDCVIDVGCGTGSATKTISEINTAGKTIGIEPSEEMLKTARSYNQGNSRVSFLQLSAEDLNSINSFQLNAPPTKILAFNAVHLFKKRLEFFKGAADLLPTGGTLAFSTGFSDQSLTRESIRDYIKFFRSIQREAKTKYANEFGDFKQSDTTAQVNITETKEELTQLGFSSIEVRIIPVKINSQEILSFFTLPGVIDTILPNTISDIERSRLLVSALKGTSSFKRNWLLLKTTKGS